MKRPVQLLPIFLFLLPNLLVAQSTVVVVPLSSDETTRVFSQVDDDSEGVSFQDGTPFNADAVLLNMAYFQRSPSSFSKISQILDRIT